MTVREPTTTVRAERRDGLERRVGSERRGSSEQRVAAVQPVVDTAAEPLYLPPVQAADAAEGSFRSASLR